MALLWMDLHCFPAKLSMYLFGSIHMILTIYVWTDVQRIETNRSQVDDVDDWMCEWDLIPKFCCCLNQLLKEPYVNNNYILYCSLSALFESIYRTLLHTHTHTYTLTRIQINIQSNVHTYTDIHLLTHSNTLYRILYSRQFHVLNKTKTNMV